jgi:hypothetical protein
LGVPLPRTRSHRCPSVPCGWRPPCALGPAPQVCGEHGTRAGAPSTRVARPRRSRPRLGRPGAAFPMRSALPPSSQRRLFQASGARRTLPAGACRRCVDAGGSRGRVRRWWGGTGPWPAERCGRLPRAPGAGTPCRPSHACASASPLGAGVGGRRTRQRHPARRVSRVRRGQGRACVPGWPAGGGAPGPVGTGQARSRRRSGAEQGLAGDGK